VREKSRAHASHDSRAVMFAAARVDCFYTRMRARAASLVRQVRRTPNSILRMIADRVDCPHMSRCEGLHSPVSVILF
jgi:hypothetical protein